MWTILTTFGPIEISLMTSSLLWKHVKKFDILQKRHCFWVDRIIWTSFWYTQKYLLVPPILIFLNPNDTLYIYTEANKYPWGSLLAQKNICTDKKGNTVAVYLPISFSAASSLTLNKDTLLKYISVRKLPIYIEQAEVIL